MPRQNPSSQCLPLSEPSGLRGPERMARPVPPLQQSQHLLIVLGLLGLQSTAPRRNPTFAVSSDEAGPSWSRANDTTSAAVTAVAKSADQARLPGIAKKHSATTKSEFVVSSVLGSGTRKAGIAGDVPPHGVHDSGQCTDERAS